VTIAKAVNEQRLWQRHMNLAKIGATAKGGVNREAFTPEEAEARKLLASWAEARGFSCAVDDIGNLFFRRAGTDPNADPVVTGSHIDSQPTGGKFDGAYGVLAGLEVLEAAEDSGITTKRPLEFVAWTNEEGGRFQPATMGSGVYTGAMDIEEMLSVQDRAGEVVRDLLPLTLAATPNAEKRPLGTKFAAYIEAHIEQGPILEMEEQTIGVVTGIQGTRWFAIEVEGSEAHAGTTPFSARRDAFRAAHAMIAEMYELTVDDEDILRFTVGCFEVSPGSPNTVPGHVYFTLDIRHPDGVLLKGLGDKVEEVCKRNAGGLPYKVRETYNVPPIQFDTDVVNRIRDSTKALDLSHRDMISGALHDAKYMNDICPAGMIFVPCEKGISHNEVEAADPKDLAAGARVLAEAMIALANQ
jgi:beta-ureidopropionase / N-carbamoyl-L-amino-acid hydrolase